MATAVKNEVRNPVLSLYPEQIIVREGFNVRHDMGDMKSLQNSIAENEIETPLKVLKTKGKTDDGYPIYELVDGHRRFAAAAKAQAAKGNGEYVMIPAEEVPADTPESKLIITMLSTGINHKELDMLERAKGIQNLIAAYAAENDGAKLKQADIARQLGVSQPHVADCILLLTATPESLKSVEKGILKASALVTMLKAGNATDVDKQLAKAVEKADATGKENVTIKNVEAAAGKPMTKKTGAASRSTKKGVTEESGPATVVGGKNAPAINLLTSLRDALVTEPRAQNVTAFSTLNAIIAYLAGKVELIEMGTVFFGETTEVIDFGAAEVPALETKSDNEPKAKIPGSKSAKKIDLKAEFAKIDEADGKGAKATAPKKGAAPAKKSAPPAKGPKIAKIEEDEDVVAEKAATKAAKGGKKSAIPEIDLEESEEDMFE